MKRLLFIIVALQFPIVLIAQVISGGVDTPTTSEGSYGYLYGQITTYYLTATGVPKHDKDYSWSVREIENHYPLIDLVCTSELDNDDAWSGHYYYKIIKIDDTFMWWQSNTNGDDSILKFKRRTDLKDM